MKKAIIYVRLETRDKEADLANLTRKLYMMASYCDRNAIEIEYMLIDEPDMSASMLQSTLHLYPNIDLLLCLGAERQYLESKLGFLPKQYISVN